MRFLVFAFVALVLVIGTHGVRLSQRSSSSSSSSQGMRLEAEKNTKGSQSKSTGGKTKIGSKSNGQSSSTGVKNLASYTMMSQGSMTMGFYGGQTLVVQIPYKNVAPIIEYKTDLSQGETYGYVRSKLFFGHWAWQSQKYGADYNVDQVMNPDAPKTYSGGSMPVGKLVFQPPSPDGGITQVKGSKHEYHFEPLRTIDFELRNVTFGETIVTIVGFVPALPHYVWSREDHPSYGKKKHFHFIPHASEFSATDQLARVPHGTVIEFWSLKIGFLFTLIALVAGGVAAAASATVTVAAAAFAALSAVGAALAAAAATAADAIGALLSLSEIIVTDDGIIFSSMESIADATADDATAEAVTDLSDALDTVSDDVSTSECVETANSDNLFESLSMKRVGQTVGKILDQCLGNVANSIGLTTVITITVWIMLSVVKSHCTKCDKETLAHSFYSMLATEAQSIGADCDHEKLGGATDTIGTLCDSVATMSCCEGTKLNLPCNGLELYKKLKENLDERRPTPNPTPHPIHVINICTIC